jgi:hypothetical protein
MGEAGVAGETGARAEYGRRHGAARDEAARRERQVALISNLRLLVFAGLVAVAWQVFASRAWAAAWLAPPALAFAALVVAHDRAIGARDRARRIAAFYELGIARLDDRWPGRGDAGSDFADPDHPYAEDLDLFGRGSLFERLSTARSQGGRQRLAEWLLAPAPPEGVRARQAAVAELRPQLDLREHLATLPGEVHAGLHPEALRGWGEAPALLTSRAARVAAALLPLASVASLGAWWLAGAPPLGFAIALAVQGGFAWALRPRVQRVVGGVDLPGRELELLAQLLARVEAEAFRAPLLRELRQALDTRGVAPSRRIRSLRSRIDLLDARRNQLFAPLAALLLWTTQLAFAIESWRAACGSALGRWIEVLGELEALVALAGYAYEEAEQPFPELLGEGARFEAEALAHPLLPRDRCVANDVALGDAPRVWVVSGSNMSGKSTLLRSVGANAVLAFAGAPVRARRLRISPLAIGASIRVGDSLLGGTSRFYAEIQRLRRIVELAEGPGPALFLLDEILAGTNSHDRGIGAEAVVRGLLERGAIGLVTTHDLALARIADGLAPRGANVHFEDHIQDGVIAFDYRLRPGVVQRSNALALMRAVGLEV